MSTRDKIAYCVFINKINKDTLPEKNSKFMAQFMAHKRKNLGITRIPRFMVESGGLEPSTFRV